MPSWAPPTRMRCSAMEKTRAAAKGDDIEAIKSAVHELEQASHALSRTLYAAAGAKAGAGAPGDGAHQERPTGQPSGASGGEDEADRRRVRGEGVISLCVRIHMSIVSKTYVDSLPLIYRHILAAFPKIEPARRAGEGLAYQTLFEHLRSRKRPLLKKGEKAEWSLGEIIEACQNMEKGGAVQIKQNIFVCPTPLGEEMITLLTGAKAGEYHVPEFPSPPED